MLSYSVPTALSLDNGDNITNPYDVANTFNNYFASIAETVKKNKICKLAFFRLFFK